MRNIYTNELNAITHRVLKMGTMLEHAIDVTREVLETLDPIQAQRIIDGDDIFDDMEREIEQDCLNVVVMQAPVAGDWRRIASIMRMISDLERIADHCSDISEYVIRLAERQRVTPPVGLSDMLSRVKSMLHTSVTAYVELDVQAANAVVAQDDAQDDAFEQVVNTLCDMMAHDPDNIPQYVDYLMIAKYLERMSDHTTNLAEWIAYIVSGVLVN
ncbi:MAG: phosphate signaling complex protein PhoU [Butyricicoccus pullicaecorum]|nr:phosphate signaling complex protein PhoU [Butyricicoccus pullicaecorum]MDO4668433.1 phosphate signaling complex protein PhoU [Butyricicoccus pullicaecorum]